MPFRYSEFASRGKSGNPWTETDESSIAYLTQPGAHNSYDFRPSPLQRAAPPPPPPLAIPSRYENHTPAYDNGTGRLDPSLVREHGLPLSVQTTEGLTNFIKHRSQERTSRPAPMSPSTYGANSPMTPVRCSEDSWTPSYTSSPPRRSFSTRVSNPATAGLRRRYGNAAPVGRLLPGSTRKHKHQGFWLRRRTVRDAEPALPVTSQMSVERKKSTNKKWWRKTRDERPASENRPQARETSEWYDSD